MRNSFRLALALVFTAGISQATTIYSATLTGDGWYTPSNTDAAVYSWTQTGTYTNVSIAADLTTDVAIGFPLAFATVNAYLMDQIGPGTTGANEIASSLGIIDIPSFFNDDISGFTLVTLFSGIELGPGTYYVVLNPTSSAYTFSFALGGATIVTDTGVTAGVNEFVNDGVGAYPPGWTFGPVGAGSSYDVSVSGDPALTPEPSTFFLSGTALGLLLLSRFRRRL
jgi:hypothetical protein